MNGPASPGNAGPPPESSGDASQPSVSRVESTKLMIDRAMGGDRHDRQLTTALLAVMVALLILIPLGSIALVLIGLGLLAVGALVVVASIIGRRSGWGRRP